MKKHNYFLKIFKEYNFIWLLFFVFSIPVITIAQNKYETKKIDSLSKLEYFILFKNYKENAKDSVLSSISLKAYLLKAKKNRDTLRITTSYLLLSKQKTGNIVYTDSVISLLSNSDAKFDERLSVAYFGKGSYYYKKYKFNKSLKYYLKANELLPGFDIDMNIGLIRLRIGEYEEALKTFQNVKIKDLKNHNNSDALWLYFALAESHRQLKNWDSTNFYVNLGHTEVNRTKIFERKPYFTLMHGAYYFGQGEYIKSLDTMVSVSKEFENNGDQANLMYNYYFTGISNYKLGRDARALNYFKKIDSLYAIINHIEPEFRTAYEVLINESLKEGDLKTQLQYVSRLLKIDSTLTKDYRFLTKNIYQKYDSPKLLEQKQRLIQEINKENSKAYLWLKTSVLSLLVLGLIVFHFIRQNSINKKKFKSLLQDIEKKKVQKSITSKDKKLNINPEVVTMILKRIEKFEENKEFTRNDITLNVLAQQFETNSKYLSKTIKHYKRKNFSDYINTLRIDYAIVELKNKVEYKKYTLKAIANEFGFNSAESFSSAFFKNTELKPSYFLKELWQEK